MEKGSFQKNPFSRDSRDTPVQEPAPLVHIRCPRDTIWYAYPTCPGLQVDSIRRYIRCAQCGFVTLFSECKLLARIHDQCAREAVPILGGPGISPLPDHVSLCPLGNTFRLLCLVCGGRDHLSRRAIFLDAHRGCEGVLPAEAAALHQPTACVRSAEH